MRRLGAWLTLVVLVVGGCSSQSGEGLRLYTTVTQETVDAVLASFEAETGQTVEVLRVPTGELNARIASELRSGGVSADLLWLTDPLSIERYEADGLLAEWTPVGAERIPDAYTTATSWGTRVLHLVIVVGEGTSPRPTKWTDLAIIDGPIAIPDPGFAGSAFAALAYFGLTEGLTFYEALAEAGAVQVQSPGEVVTGVAEGRFTAGITLDFAARAAMNAGSPISIVWPEPGAVTFHSPIAVTADSNRRKAAEAFVEFVLSDAGQNAIAQAGWQPVVAGIGAEPPGPQVTLDWSVAVERQDELLAGYRDIFGG